MNTFTPYRTDATMTPVLKLTSGSYSDWPPEGFCSSGAFCWIKEHYKESIFEKSSCSFQIRILWLTNTWKMRKKKCSDWYKRNAYCDTTTIDFPTMEEADDISLGACRKKRIFPIFFLHFFHVCVFFLYNYQNFLGEIVQRNVTRIMCALEFFITRLKKFVRQSLLRNFRNFPKKNRF